ncbi:hypothetical protein ACROYT_G028332 [Oculina patagonica]
MHHPAKPLFTKVVMSVLSVILTSASVLGNGFVLAVIARFKSLRTAPNILVANLAVVDLFNAVINIPPHMMYGVLEASWFRGKTLTIMTSIFNRLFTLLNLASMLAMMAEVYLAISFEVRYHVWKTKKKSLVCGLLIWLFSIVTTILSSIPLLDIDLGDAHARVYRAVIFEQAKYFVASLMAFFIICDIVVYSLTTRAIRKKKKERAELNLSLVQAEARPQDDIKAINTITITVAAYFLCYVPSILYAVLGGQKENLADSWFGFIASYSLYISSAVNPIIYYLRKSRCRYAFKQFLKDPFGSSDFKEKPNGRGNGEKRHDKAMEVRKKAESGESGGACEVERSVSQTRQTYRGQRRNAVTNSSTENLQAGLYSDHKVGDDSGYIKGKAEKGGEARANLQVQNLYDGKGDRIEEGNDKVPKKCGMEKESRRRPPSSSRNKVHPLVVIEMDRTGEPEDEKGKVTPSCSRWEIKEQETSGKRRKAITSGQMFEKVLKAAWIDEEDEE